MCVYLITSGDYSDYTVEFLMETDLPFQKERRQALYKEFLAANGDEDGYVECGLRAFCGWLEKQPGVRRVQGVIEWHVGGYRAGDESAGVRAIDDGGYTRDYE